jgi:hypothetical protein
LNYGPIVIFHIGASLDGTNKISTGVTIFCKNESDAQFGSIIRFSDGQKPEWCKLQDGIWSDWTNLS